MRFSKKIVIYSFVFIIMLSLIIHRFVIKRKVKIKYYSQIKRNEKEIPFDWFIITGEEQAEIIKEDGISIPKNDYKKYFLILSKYKIDKIHYNMLSKTPDTGTPFGHVEFDQQSSDENFYYIYFMKTVWLSQAVE